MDHTKLRRTGKFLLFSCSAGLIELGSFALFNEVSSTQSFTIKPET